MIWLLEFKAIPNDSLTVCTRRGWDFKPSLELRVQARMNQKSAKLAGR